MFNSTAVAGNAKAAPAGARERGANGRGTLF
jgi:hypothetical protein